MFGTLQAPGLHTPPCRQALGRRPARRERSLWNQLTASATVEQASTTTQRAGANGVQNGASAQEAATRTRPGEKKGFVEEMRIAAMKHHTRGQAPKEGTRPEQENPTPQSSTPTKKGYLQFLAESKVVYDTFDQLLNEAARPEYRQFQHTGLERAQPLTQDIQWLQQEHDLPAPQVASTGPGSEYAALLSQLAREDPAAFTCHFYNFYFAHTAGGRMIGARVSQMLLDDATLEFYKWDGDVKAHLEGVRNTLNEVAEGWTREQKDRCLQETTKCFQTSGAILRTIVETP